MMDLIIPNELPIVVQPTVVNTFGQTQAELLSRLKYWMNRATKHREGCLWVYKTVEQWASELNKSVKTIQRTIKDLEQKKVLISKQFESKDWYHGKSYRIDLDVLYKLLGIPKPVDKKRHDVQEDRQSDLIITPNTTISKDVCMDSEVKKIAKEEFWKDEIKDLSFLNVLKDSNIDPNSYEGISLYRIAMSVKATSDQLKEALHICYNSKTYIKNIFGFVKKILRDFISSDKSYFDYHYRSSSVKQSKVDKYEKFYL